MGGAEHARRRPRGCLLAPPSRGVSASSSAYFRGRPAASGVEAWEARSGPRSSPYALRRFRHRGPGTSPQRADSSRVSAAQRPPNCPAGQQPTRPYRTAMAQALVTRADAGAVIRKLLSRVTEKTKQKRTGQVQIEVSGNQTWRCPVDWMPRKAGKGRVTFAEPRVAGSNPGLLRAGAVALGIEVNVTSTAPWSP